MWLRENKAQQTDQTEVAQHLIERVVPEFACHAVRIAYCELMEGEMLSFLYEINGHF